MCEMNKFQSKRLSKVIRIRWIELENVIRSNGVGEYLFQMIVAITIAIAITIIAYSYVYCLIVLGSWSNWEFEIYRAWNDDYYMIIWMASGNYEYAHCGHANIGFNERTECARAREGEGARARARGSYMMMPQNEA